MFLGVREMCALWFVITNSAAVRDFGSTYAPEVITVENAIMRILVTAFSAAIYPVARKCRTSSSKKQSEDKNKFHLVKLHIIQFKIVMVKVKFMYL